MSKWLDINFISSANAGDLPPELLQKVIKKESAGKPNATSPVGAQGLMQLMPATARQYGVTDPYDPVENVKAGSKFLSDLVKQYGGNVSAALAHYNGGTKQGKRVAAGLEPSKAETRDYVRTLGGANASKANAQGTSPPTGQTMESTKTYDKRRVALGVMEALKDGISESDIVKHLSTMPGMDVRIQGAVKAGATPRQILEAAGGDSVGKFYKLREEWDPMGKSSTYDKFMTGMGKRFVDYYQGGKRALGLASPEDIAKREALDARIMGSVPAQLGAVGTDVAVGSLLPAGAGTAAGRVALGAAGGAAQGALGAAGTGQDIAEGAGYGGLAGGAGGALASIPAPVITKAKNVLTNKWADPAKRELFEAAQKKGVTLTPEQMGSEAGKVIGRLQEYNPLGMLGGGEKKQIDQVRKAVEATGEKFITPRIAQEGPESVVIDSVRKSAQAAKDAASKKYDRVAELAEATGTSNVKMNNFRQAANEVSSDLQDVFDKFGLTKLKDRVKEVEFRTNAKPTKILGPGGQPLMKEADLTFAEARALRTDIGSAVRQAERASMSGTASEQEAGALKRLYKGLMDDLDKWGETNPAVHDAWKSANKAYKEDYQKVFREAGNVKSIIKPTFDPDRLISSTLLPQHPEKAAKLINAMDEEGKQAAKVLLVRRALEPFGESPAKTVRLLDFGASGKNIFNPEELKELDFLRETIKRTMLSENAEISGRSARHIAGVLGIGVASTALGPGSLAIPIGLSGLHRLSKSGVGRRMLMTSAKPKLGRTAKAAVNLATVPTGQALAQGLRYLGEQ